MDECKEAWKTAQTDLVTVKTLMDHMQTYQNPQIPFHKLVGDGFTEIESCLQEVKTAHATYSDVKTVKKMLKRGMLKSQAVSCVTRINKVLQIFQVFNFQLSAHEKSFLDKFNCLQLRLALANFLTSQQQVQPRENDASSGILQCPPPDKYFVGQSQTLVQLSRVFTSTVVTIHGETQEALRKCVERLPLQYVMH